MLDGVTIPSGGSYPIPEDATTIDLCSNLPAFEPLGAADASVSGCTITYTVTWQPADGQEMTTDPPPSTAILRADLPWSAGYFGATNARHSGTVSASVSLSINGTQYADHQDNTSGVDMSINWGASGSPHECVIETVPPDTGSFTYTVTVSEGTNINYNGSGYGSQTHVYSEAIVTPSVSVTPVVVNLDGITPSPTDGSKNILIGQGCRASLSAGTYTLSNYAWEIDGDTFKSYEAHGVASGGWANATFLGDADLHAASPLWYWRSEDGLGSETNDVSGSADAYDGATLLGYVAGTRTVTVWAPYFFCGYNARNATLDIDAGGNVFIGAGTWTQDGIDWEGRAIPPDPFPAGAGKWSFVQTMYSNRSYVENGVAMCSPNNGLPGLDTSYPYQPDGGVMEADDDNAGWADDDTNRWAGDRPDIEDVPDSYSNVSFSDQFWTFMMYRPPDKGQGHMWVPLHQTAWQWSANVERPAESWLNWPNWVGPVPWVLGPVTVTVNGRWLVHPEWTRVLLADTPYEPCQ